MQLSMTHGCAAAQRCTRRAGTHEQPPLLQEGLPEEIEPIYIGSLPVEIEPEDQEVRAAHSARMPALHAVCPASAWTVTPWAGVWLPRTGARACACTTCISTQRVCASTPRHLRDADVLAVMQAVALELLSFDCYPVFLSPELKQKYYQGTPRPLVRSRRLVPSRLAVVKQGGIRRRPGACRHAMRASQGCLEGCRTCTPCGAVPCQQHCAPGCAQLLRQAGLPPCAGLGKQEPCPSSSSGAGKQRLACASSGCARRLLQAAAVAPVPLPAAAVPAQLGPLPRRALAGVHQGQQGGRLLATRCTASEVQRQRTARLRGASAWSSGRPTSSPTTCMLHAVAQATDLKVSAATDAGGPRPPALSHRPATALGAVDVTLSGAGHLCASKVALAAQPSCWLLGELAWQAWRPYILQTSADWMPDSISADED